MLFEVIASADNHVVMRTTHTSCIPYEDLKLMESHGYRFRMDGKLLKANQLLKANHSESKSEVYVIRCKDTGESFKTQSEAAKHFNIDPAQVSDSIKTGRPRSGYTFERVLS